MHHYRLWLVWVMAVVVSISVALFITQEWDPLNTYHNAKCSCYSTGKRAEAASAADGSVSQRVDQDFRVEYVPAGQLLRTSGVPILMYHSIRVDPHNTLCVAPEQFAAQLNYLEHHGYTTITLAQLLRAYLNDGNIPAKPIVITFDDGYRDNYQFAYPLLKQRNMVATCFVLTSKIGTPDGLTPGEIREMHDYGIEIGSHTIHHLDLRELGPSELEKEIVGSKEMLKDIIGDDVVTFAYPSGKYSLQAVDMVKRAGYVGAVTVHSGVADAKDNIYLWPRIRVSGGESLDEFVASLSSRSSFNPIYALN